MTLEIQHGARTVSDLAQHFERMKQRAAAFVKDFEASDRGYFTPTEDEQTRHLLVSYRQSRNALFELVTSFHQLDRFAEEQRAAALAVAYGGALALVDVARFLRDNFHHRKIVRAKLNEPEPNFGIPAGTYDAIQKSLTSPVHAWHLYHASDFFARHENDLRQRAQADDGLAIMLDIIDRYQDRLDVSFNQFVLARARVRGRSLRTRLGRNLLGRAIYGLQKCVSSLVADRYVKADHEPRLPESVAGEFANLLQPGDIIVVRKEHAYTNYFLPGYWPHAALYLGTADELAEMQLDPAADFARQLGSGCVLESMKDGVLLRPVANPFQSDAIAVIRPQLEQSSIQEAIRRGLQHLNKPYDFDFDFSRSDRLVCTEVVYRAYEGIDGLSFELTRRAGRLNLSAEDLLQRGMNKAGFQTAAVFCPAMSESVAYDDQAVALLRDVAERL